MFVNIDLGIYSRGIDFRLGFTVRFTFGLKMFVVLNPELIGILLDYVNIVDS